MANASRASRVYVGVGSYTSGKRPGIYRRVGDGGWEQLTKGLPDTTNVQAVSDAGGVITFGLTNQSNRFNVGLSLRPVARYAYEDRIPSSSLLKTQKTAPAPDDDGNEIAPTGDKRTIQDRLRDDANKSQGLGVDFGMMYTVADFWYPTIGFSVLNLPTGCHDNYHADPCLDLHDDLPSRPIAPRDRLKPESATPVADRLRNGYNRLRRALWSSVFSVHSRSTATAGRWRSARSSRACSRSSCFVGERSSRPID